MSIKVCNLKCEYKKNPIGIDTKNPRFFWQIESDKLNCLQTAYHIIVSRDMNFNDIVWDSSKVYSDESIHVEYKGKELQPRTRYYYKVKVWDNNQNQSEWSNISFFETGLLDNSAWIAEWITVDESHINVESCPYFRKEFKTSKKVRNARVYITSCGLYELYLNGKRCGDYYFTPGWTSYKKRVQYQTYDVTELINEENAIGVILGPGWYKGNIGFGGQRNFYGDRLALLFQMHIEYQDGTEDIITSDNTWKYSFGPILLSEIYHGERYDANLELIGWDKVHYNDSTWECAKLYNYPKNHIIAHEGAFVRKIEEIKPVEFIITPKGERVIDFGQNMVGWVRFKATGNKGDKVIIKHAEVLDKEGNFYTTNLRSAKQTIEYILKGEDYEVFEPHFTFQGFRYILLEEYPGEINLENFTGIVLHSDMEETGYFECSNDYINKLQHNIKWGQKGNFLDVPTDCPQRDERLGWAGDCQVFINTACFNMNTASFFTKWLHDLKADQLANGGIPYVIPNVLEERAHSSAAWGDAATICPWTIYLYYGDKRLLEEQYESMKAWVEYIRNQGDNEYLWNTGFHYGDWLGLDAKEGSYIGATPKDYIATAFYAYSTKIVRDAALILGKVNEVREYNKLLNNIVNEFNKEFVTPNGRLAAPTQTAHVLALMFDLVDDKIKPRIAKTLNDMIVENDYHLTTGFVGTPYICHVLSEYGYHETAVKLLLQESYPSWLYPITKGATTIWEHWDGIKPDGSFWSADMNSFNHYAYGSIGDWMYKVLAGINYDDIKPAFKHIKINPKNSFKYFSYIKSSYKSLYGIVKVNWEVLDHSIKFFIEIPANTSAEVFLPLAKIDTLYNEEKILLKDFFGSEIFQENNGVRFNIGSGKYYFEYTID
ncbi:family 78 glycoside hydrolase catalytic domain [Caldicellulosiruptoraceae bacterium PP1]